jgi:superfamily II DNA or RNA helicase
MSKNFRYYQKEADDAVYVELLINNKCIVKKFCGTGKSLLMRHCKIAQHKNLVVYVFPSLNLIKQFYTDYLHDFPSKNILKISSEDDSTTNPVPIRKFLSKKLNKIICITYQSLKVLLDNLGGIKINVCIYDEAHHAVGEVYQKLIFEENNDICEKQIFFTATPKNANGIIMYDRENLEACMCGKLVYDYSYLRGVNECYLNPFEIRIDMSTENTNKSVYESIARAILESGNNRVLTFHSDVNTERDTSVNNFVDEAEFKLVFETIQREEFNHLLGKYKKINMVGLSADIKPSDRARMLGEFDTTLDDDIYIISSCETIGEGIDTKNANMCVFVDPKSSYVKIIQNVGRIVRKVFGEDKPNSTILIPCWVDKTKYLECNGDREKCDEVIRQDMSDTGNFNGILNVTSALRQEDADLYDICLNYPNVFSPQEINSNLEKQGYMIDDIIGDGYLLETMEHLLDTEIDFNDYNYDCEEDLIMKTAEDNNVCIEIHTNSLENPVERYNGTSNDTIRLYKNVLDDAIDACEMEVYYPIVKKDKKTKRNTGGIKEPNKNNRLRVNVHANPDVKVLWNIVGDLDLTRDVCSCIIDCEIVDKTENWKQNLNDVKKYIDENSKLPSDKDKDKIIKSLGKWISHQKENYDIDITKSKQGMGIEERHTLWTEFVEKYKEYFITNDEIWKQTLIKVKNYIDTNDKPPSQRDKNKTIQKLGNWINNQKANYDIDITKCKQSMKLEEIYTLWTDFIQKYNKYFMTPNELWKQTLNKVKIYIDTNNKLPYDKDKSIKSLGGWISKQKPKYDINISKCKEGMNFEERHTLWTEFIEEYKEYFMTNEENWKQTLINVKNYIDTNSKLPSRSETNKTIKLLSVWISTQKTNYNEDISKSKYIMNFEEIHTLWTEFVEEYKEYIDLNENWKQKLIKVKTYIDTNGKPPSQYDKDKTIKSLSEWINTQKENYDIDISKCKQGMKLEEIYALWTEFVNDNNYKEYFMTNNEAWKQTLINVKNYINTNGKPPSQYDKDKSIKSLGKWIGHQKENYDIDITKSKQSMKQEERHTLWTEFVEEYLTTSIPVKKSMALKTKPIVETEEPTSKEKIERRKSELSVLHQKYKTMNSQTLATTFKSNPELWSEYHAISEENEQSFLKEGIPRNRIIKELTKIKRPKLVVDMGCGKAEISKHFANNQLFQFINYDHIASNSTVIQCDISATPLDDNGVDIVILSLAMWGSNCRDYIKEAHRILDLRGTLYLIEPTKRWSEKNEMGDILVGQEGNKMRNLLIENGFKIMEETIEKFCMFICVKI